MSKLMLAPPRRAIESAKFRRGYAERLRRTRELLGISEEEAAAAFQITLRTYRRYELGKPHRDNHSGTFNFVDTYGLDLDWLFRGDAHGSPPLPRTAPLARRQQFRVVEGGA